jgi:hypothetical protein
MNSTTIKIDGAKLRELLETKTGKTIYQIATESGYSKNVISNAIKKGYASSAVQNIARLYEIYPDDYKVIEPDPEEIEDFEEIKGQISIDDIETIKREELKELFKQAIREESLKSKELKALIKEALIEIVNAQEFRTCFDPHRQIFEIYTRVKED